MTVENESVHALTGAYVLDALAPEELAAFEQHLADCPDCREEVRTLRAAVIRLPSLSPVAPPAELRASVMDAIAAVRPLPPLPEQTAAEPADGDELSAVRRRRDRRARRWRLAAAAAAVVALAGIGWGLLQPSEDRGRDLSTIERESDARLLELLEAPDLEVYATTDTSGVRGTVLRSDSLGIAAMLVQDLPSIDSDETFQAWTIAGADPADAGVFAGTDGSATVLLTGDVTTADAVAVTIEPTGGSPSPTGDLVLQVPVSG